MKRGHSSRLSKLSFQEKTKRAERNERRERARKLAGKRKKIPGEPDQT